MNFIFQLFYEITSWVVKSSTHHPKIFTFTFFGLILFFIVNNLVRIKKYINIRKELFNRVIETRRQAKAHQHTRHSVDHALEPHKKEKSEYLQEITNKLYKFDPIKKEVENLIKDLQAANSFEQSEDTSEQFLKKHKKI